MNIPLVKTADYDYDLPQECIAQFPLNERDASKLLVHDAEGNFRTDTYANIANYIPENSLIVFNNSKVVPARILFVKDTAGVIELFCLAPIEGTPYQALQQQASSKWICMIGGLKKWRTTQPLTWQLESIDCKVEATFLGKNDHGFIVQFDWTNATKTFAEILTLLGQMPIPPYLMRKAVEEDATRYQTVYASVEGSVAAPTAGLHFTDKIFARLYQKNISIAYTTLHVGAGTFKPVNADFAHEHNMHAEWIEIDTTLIMQLLNASTITAVGTTSLRTLESIYWYAFICSQNQTLQDADFVLPQFIPYEQVDTLPKNILLSQLLNYMHDEKVERIYFQTALMIMPSYSMKIATRLVTNFHQPKSTLLMLVDAFTKGTWKPMYDYALANNFRFLSYGDGCIIEWN